MGKSPCNKCVNKKEELIHDNTIYTCGKGHHKRFLTKFNANTCEDYSKNKNKDTKVIPLFSPQEKGEKIIKIVETEHSITGYYD